MCGSAQVCSILVCCSRCVVFSGGGGQAIITLWPAGSAICIAIGLGASTRISPLGLAIVPCGPGNGCCDTPGRLRPVRTFQAVRRCTVKISTICFHSFTRDVQATICLICWSCAAFHINGYCCTYSPSRLGYGSATHFQRFICRTVMLTVTLLTSE